MPPRSTSEARKKQNLVQMAELQSRLKKLRMLARKKRNGHKRQRLGAKICHLKVKYLRMVEAQRQRGKTKKEKRIKPCSRELIHLMVQRMKSMLTQEQGMISLHKSNTLSKKMEKLKKLAHKTPQDWKLFKGIIKRLDMAFSGLIPVELALSTAPKKIKPMAVADVTLGPYRVPVEREGLRSTLTPPRVSFKENARKSRSLKISLTALNEERRGSHRNRAKSKSPDIPQEHTMKQKLEGSHEPDRIQKDLKNTAHPSKGLRKHVGNKKSAINFDEISQSSLSESLKLSRFRTIEIEPSDSKLNSTGLFGLDSSGESTPTSYTSSLSYGTDSNDSSSINKPFNLLGRFRHYSYRSPLKASKKASKESGNRPLDIMDSIRNRITITATSHISRAKINAALDDAVCDVPYHENLLEASQQDHMSRHDREMRQKRLNRSPISRKTRHRSESYSSLHSKKHGPKPQAFPVLNVAEVREEWVQYFATLEKSPMELLLEQRRNEKAALEAQRQEAQLQEAERQRIQLQKQTHPWRWRRRPKMVQDMYTLSELFPQPKQMHEVCPECGMCVCCSENIINPSPIVVTEAMINKFKYLRVA